MGNAEDNYNEQKPKQYNLVVSHCQLSKEAQKELSVLIQELAAKNPDFHWLMEYCYFT